MDNILKNILKPEAYMRYQYILPLLKYNIKLDTNTIFRLFNIIKNNYVYNQYKLNIVSQNDFNLVKQNIKNWRNIPIIHKELNNVKNIYLYTTNNLKLYLIEPFNINCNSLFNKIINIAYTLEKFSSKTGIVYIFPINYNRDLIIKKFNNINHDLEKLEKNYFALTIAGQVFASNSNVFVIRNEECIKLFIHEILHLFKLDISHNDDVENNINFNCYLTGGTFESYTELYSNLLNIFFFVIRNNLEKYLIDLVKIEIIYSIYCSGKLLYLYGYDTTNFKDFFFKKDSSKIIFNNIPSIYYYIIKSIYFICCFVWLKLIDNNLKIDNHFFYIEKDIIHTCIHYKTYHNILYDSLKLIHDNNDKSLSYIILDEYN
jgi:hypothetical protein